MSAWNVRKVRGVGCFSIELNALQLSSIHQVAKHLGVSQEDILAAIINKGFRILYCGEDEVRPTNVLDNAISEASKAGDT